MSKIQITNTDLLLIIDPQNDFCEGGALAVNGADAAFIAALDEFARMFEAVGLSQDWHDDDQISFAKNHEGGVPFTDIEVSYGIQTLWPVHCVKGSKGAEFHEGLLETVNRSQIIIRKGTKASVDSYSAFYENDHKTPTGFMGYIKEMGFNRVFIAGLALDYCVAYSAIDLGEAFQGLVGLDVFVVEDMTRAIDLGGSLNKARIRMQDAGVQLIDSTDIA